MRVPARQPRAWAGDAVGRGQECLDAFRSFFAMGKIRATPCIRRHIPAHRATTKYFSNSFWISSGSSVPVYPYRS
jgi:hypothetical protein